MDGRGRIVHSFRHCVGGERAIGAYFPRVPPRQNREGVLVAVVRVAPEQLPVRDGGPTLLEG